MQAFRRFLVATTIATAAAAAWSGTDVADVAALAGLHHEQADAVVRSVGAQAHNLLGRIGDERACVPSIEPRVQLAAAWRAPGADGGSAAAPNPFNRPGQGCADEVSAWAAGSVVHARPAGADPTGDHRLSTPGVSCGLDGALATGLRLGMALSQGDERSDPGGSDRVSTSSGGVAAYVSWLRPGSVRLGAALGQGRATARLQRGARRDRGATHGKRGARQNFAVVSASAWLASGRWRLHPRRAAGHRRIRLGAYAEAGDPQHALGFDEAQLASTEWRGALRLTGEWPVAGCTLAPSVLLEWRKRSQVEMSQSVHRLADASVDAAMLERSEAAQEEARLGLGLDLRMAAGWRASFETRSTLGGTAPRSMQVAANMRRSF